MRNATQKWSNRCPADLLGLNYKRIQIWKRGKTYVGGFCKFLFLKFNSLRNRSVIFNAFGQPHWWSLLRGEETREPVLSCTENKDLFLATLLNVCVILFITGSHGKHKTHLTPCDSTLVAVALGARWARHAQEGCVLYVHASTCMYINVCVLKSHSDCLMSGGLQQRAHQNWVGWRGAVPFVFFSW